MSILKIRDENGNVHPIAIMKGDKGDGVPDGGSPGQVIKKTESGTEWGDTGIPDGGSAGQVLKKTESGTEWGGVTATSTCDALFTNTDIAIDSHTIEKRGLYEVTVSYSTSNTTAAIDASYYANTIKHLMSVSDLDERQEQKIIIGLYTYNDESRHQEISLKYNNRTFTTSYSHAFVANGNLNVRPNRSYLAEVRLIIPYE